MHRLVVAVDLIRKTMIRFSDSQPHWRKYYATVRAFESVLEHAKAVSGKLVGLTPTSEYVRYGEQIFVKLLAHCVSLRGMAPDPTRKTDNELWDSASLSAVSRCVIEAHDAFSYLTIDGLTVEERDFRIKLWELHGKNRRLKMLKAIGSRDSRLIPMQAEEIQLQRAVVGAQFFQTASPSVKQRVLDGDPPPFHLSQRERCKASGVNFDYYNALTMHLSQSVHTHPFSIQQLSHFRAGSSDALAMMSLPLDYALPFLARVTDDIRNLFPGKTHSPPSRTAKTMHLWKTISAQGVNGS